MGLTGSSRWHGRTTGLCRFPKCSNAWRSSPPQRTAACRLNPSISAHSVCLKSFSLGMAPCTVSTFWPARGPQAMRQVHAAACSGLSTRAWSESPSLSAMWVEPSSSTNTPCRVSSLRQSGVDLVQHHLQRFIGWRAAAPVHAIQQRKGKWAFEKPSPGSCSTSLLTPRHRVSLRHAGRHCGTSVMCARR